jgi:predicted trehalose synthase
MLALDNAFNALTQARDAYTKGQNAQVDRFTKEIQESVELADTSLQQTGKNPRKSPKWFKRAESSTRDLLRRLDAFQQAMDATDRPMLDAVKAKVQQVHDDLLLGVLEGKEK